MLSARAFRNCVRDRRVSPRTIDELLERLCQSALLLGRISPRWYSKARSRNDPSTWTAAVDPRVSKMCCDVSVDRCHRSPSYPHDRTETLAKGNAHLGLNRATTDHLETRKNILLSRRERSRRFSRAPRYVLLKRTHSFHETFT